MSVEEFSMLYASASSGDRLSLEKIYLQYKNTIHALAHRYANGVISVDDLASEARLWLVNTIRLRKFDATTGRKFMSYLYPSIVGVMKNFIRSNAAQINMKAKKEYSFVSFDAMEGFDIAEEQTEEEDRTELIQLLLALPEREKDAIVSHYWKVSPKIKAKRQARDYMRMKGIQSLKKKLQLNSCNKIAQ